MRLLSYLLVLAGIYSLAMTGYDAFRGVTGAPVLFGPSNYPIPVDVGHIQKKTNPDIFQGAMAYHWFDASLILVAGVVLFLIDKKQESLDPLSSEFGGTNALDELDEEMRKKEANRRNPKP